MIKGIIIGLIIATPLVLWLNSLLNAALAS